MASTQKQYEVEQTMKLSFYPRSMSLQDALKAPRLIRKNFEVPLNIQNGESVLIGRDDSVVSIVIHSEFISRVHAAILYKNGKFYLRDLHSKNGSFLNGEALDPKCNSRELMDGDKLRFNHVEFLFCEMI